MSRRILSFTLICFFLFVTSSCAKKEVFRMVELNYYEDFVIFGTGQDGSCEDAFRNFFLLTEDALRKSVDTQGKSTPCKLTNFYEEPLTQEDYELAKVLFDVPSYILEDLIEVGDLDHSISDGDRHIYGRIDGQAFELISDGPTSDAPQELFDYYEGMISIYLELIK